MLLTCNGLCTERCEGSRKNLRVLNATKIAGLLVTSRKAYILFSTQMVRPILQVRQPLLLPQRRRTPAPSANAPIAVKSATSKPTKSASYHLIYNLSPAFCYFSSVISPPSLAYYAPRRESLTSTYHYFQALPSP